MQIKFVDSIPRADGIKEDCLYVSMKYNMTMHRCACGCGSLVPLPISPADWSLSYDGERISLSPSVGNGALECRSHYFIRDSQIIWLPKISDLQTRGQAAADEAMLQVQLRQRNQSTRPDRLVRRIAGKFVTIFKNVTKH